MCGGVSARLVPPPPDKLDYGASFRLSAKFVHIFSPRRLCQIVYLRCVRHYYSRPIRRHSSTNLNLAFAGDAQEGRKIKKQRRTPVALMFAPLARFTPGSSMSAAVSERLLLLLSRGSVPQVCWVNRGGFLGVLVLACYAPLAALSALGPNTYRCLAMATAPRALDAACTMAASIGRVEAVLQRVLPGVFFIWIVSR